MKNYQLLIAEALTLTFALLFYRFVDAPYGALGFVLCTSLLVLLLVEHIRSQKD